MTGTIPPSHRAADPAISAWVSAHAGSGKTYTLANRVTRLLLAGVPPARILCLTYTKTAAAEMQHRLFKQLGEWAMLPDDPLRAAIAEIGGKLEDGDLARARRLFALALETPGGLKIQTIHAFCQGLLTRFPLEAGVTPGFRVLDDQSARALVAAARSFVLTRAGSGDAELSAAAAYLVTQTSEYRLASVLDAAMGNDRSRLERVLAPYADDREAFLTAVRKAHGAGLRDSYERIALAFCEEAARDEAELRRIIAWLASGSDKDGERGTALANALAIPAHQTRFEALCAAVLKADGGLYKRLATAKLEKQSPSLYAALSAFAERAHAAQERCRAAHAAELAEAALTLADAVRRRYSEEKHARGVLDYNDLIAAAGALLTRGDAAQWVLYKLDGGIDHILIDEAQDTSPEQWAIVRALSSEFFAGDSARSDVTRTIFAVGDEKQSIFSFQGAAPTQFEVNRRHFEQVAGGPGGMGFVGVDLDVSRRSTDEILRFVDAVFADPAARDGLTSSANPIQHHAHRRAKGRVELWPTLKPSDEETHDVWAPVDAPSEDSPAHRLAQALANHIGRLCDGQTFLPGHETPIRPGDILVLLPRRQPFASAIVRALKDRNIAVAGADRLRLIEQMAVMDLIALGRFVLLPEDDLTLAALLRSPLFGVSEEALFALAHGRSTTLWQALKLRADEDATLRFAADVLGEMQRLADTLAPFEFYAAALGRHGMTRRLLARLGPDAADAIGEFQALALAYEQLNTPNLQGFLHWLETGAIEIKRDMEKARDEVRVMTVHGAKGLEADIVILPDTCGVPQPPGRHGELLYTEEGAIYPVSDQQAPPSVLAAKKAAQAKVLEEHRRLLYVALTRARDQLIIAGFENRKGLAEGCWYAHCARAARQIGHSEDIAGQDVLVFGEGAPERRNGFAISTAASAPLPDWVRRPAPPVRERPRLIRPSAAEAAPSAPSPLGGSLAPERGILIHALLARLPDLAPAQRRSAALRYLDRRGVAPTEATALFAEVEAVLNDPAFAAAFAPGGRAEAAIAAELPELGADARIAGRIDRLTVTADHVFAIDFKTSRDVPPTPEAAPRLYVAQMALYAAGLAKIFPQKRIATALVWTAAPRLMPLPQPLLAAALGRLKDRLKADGEP